MFKRGKGDLEGQRSARGLNTKMSKIFRLADGVLDLGLVKLVNLGIDPDKSVEPLINAWEYIAQIIKVHYNCTTKLNTEYVSNFDMDCTLNCIIINGTA